jgi:putative addiction module component (TIGR02574 family)
MHTTLRIQDALYREAKARAARMGVSLTRYIEDALRTRIEGEGATVREAAPDYDASGTAALAVAQDLLKGRRAAGNLARFSKEERADLAALLLDFDEEEEGAEEAWTDEIKARLKAIDDGTAVGIPWEDVEREARKLLGK